MISSQPEVIAFMNHNATLAELVDRVRCSKFRLLQYTKAPCIQILMKLNQLEFQTI
jgi:hypothetical protein